MARGHQPRQRPRDGHVPGGLFRQRPAGLRGPHDPAFHARHRLDVERQLGRSHQHAGDGLRVRAAGLVGGQGGLRTLAGVQAQRRHAAVRLRARPHLPHPVRQRGRACLRLRRRPSRAGGDRPRPHRRSAPRADRLRGLRQQDRRPPPDRPTDRLAAPGAVVQAGVLTPPGRGLAAAVHSAAVTSTKEPDVSFSSDFVWGAATASYQIEGGFDADGKGLSVWDVFTHTPGKIWYGQTGDVACDHYHRYREDVALMQSIGLQGYRFSISWPRVLPEGVGAVNEAGLAFYDRLVDALLAAGVQPWVTLFHWDFPYALYTRGGWLNPASSDWFAEYAGVVVDRLGDRVTHWMTLNEPQCTAMLGHKNGHNAPGVMLPMREVLQVTHHVLLAHGKAVQVIRARAKAAPTVGWAPVGVIREPVTDSPDDVQAARQAMFAFREPGLWNNTWYTDPAVLGHYPADGLAQFGADAPTIRPGDMETICQPLDFYGANIYNAAPVRMGPDGQWQDAPRAPGHPITHNDWPVTPGALYWGPKLLHERYGLPIVVTENGMTGHDWVDLDGAVHDAARIDFLRRYLRQYRRAADEGIPLAGYFHWSLMDNFEWAHGFRYRFGLIHVDYTTQKRTPKDSAAWYREVIATNGANL
ncbi:MAG: beta-glucosidase [Planctomycetes bacterium]|nr:beta-glucosidase [Planctomycetota bacterium]